MVTLRITLISWNHISQVEIWRKFFANSFFFVFFLKTLASLSPARELPLFCSLCCVERVCFAKVLVFFFLPLLRSVSLRISLFSELRELYSVVVGKNKELFFLFSFSLWVFEARNWERERERDFVCVFFVDLKIAPSRERERERVCVCVCFHSFFRTWLGGSALVVDLL